MAWDDIHVNMQDLIGLTFKDVSANPDGSEIIFTTVDDVRYKMYHSQDCCESVTIEDINGELEWLVGVPILMAEESGSPDPPPDVVQEYTPESQTWTFYRMGTIKGWVVMRWYGVSNGYYSESVSLVRMP